MAPPAAGGALSAEDPSSSPPRVVILGPERQARGGIASVATAWLASPAMAGVDIEYFPTMKEGSRAVKAAHMAGQQARFMGRLARGWRPDLVHVHLSYHTSFYRKALYIEQALAVGLRVVAHVHAPDLEGFAAAGPQHRAAMKHVFGRVHRVVVLSEAMARTLRQLCGDGIRLEVIYNPVAIDKGAAPRPATAAPVCLFMGEIGDRKGTFDLVDAMPAVLAQVPGARFRFGGNGDVAGLKARLADRGVAGSADVLGWVSGEAKQAEFAGASVYCLPSYHEGLPMSVLEAMAAGLPVLSTPIAGIPEAVIDGQTGALVPPGDVAGLSAALRRLLGDGAYARILGQAGLDRARRLFDADVVVGQVRALWQTLLDEVA